VRIVTVPTLSFDVYEAAEDLTKADMGTDPALQSVYPGSYPAGYPTFDDLDFPRRDAEVLAFRLDTKVQGRTADGEKRNLLVHSLSLAHDFEPEDDGWSHLESELFLGVWSGVFLTNYLDADPNEGFLRNASVGLTFEPYKIIRWRVYYAESKETKDADPEDFLGGGIDYKLGEKYRLDLSTKWDVADSRNINTRLAINRDLHDAVGRLSFGYKDHQDGADEFDVSFKLDFKLPRQK
jgi:hypothetical protein